MRSRTHHSFLLLFCIFILLQINILYGQDLFPTDSTSIQSNLQKASSFGEDKPDSLVKYLNIAIGQCAGFTQNYHNKKRDFFVRTMAQCLQQKGALYNNLNQFDSAYTSLCQSMALLVEKTSDPHEVENKLLLSSIYNSLGVYYRKINSYKDALKYYQKSLNLSEELNDSSNIAMRYTNIGIVYQETGDLVRAKEYLDEALRIHRQLNFTRGVIATTVTISNICYANKDYAQARELLIGIIAQLRELGNPSNVASVLSNLGAANKSLGNITDSKDNYAEALELYRNAKNQSGEAMVLGNMADIALLQKNYAEALKHADMQLNLANQLPGLQNKRYAYKHLYNANLGLGDYKSAVEYLELYHTIKDSIFSLDKMHEIEKLEAQYQSEKKAAEILRLKNHNELLSLKNRTRNAMLIAILLLFALTIVSGLFYYRNRQLVARKNLSELNYRLLLVQMNPHFIFNTLVTMQWLLNRQPTDVVNKYIENFTRLLRLILENSRCKLILMEKEVETLELYLETQKIRFSDNFSYSIILPEDPEFLENMIPPMIAQPFVENAIEHGFLRSASGGSLMVRFYEKDECICCEVEDNGIGIEKSSNEKGETSGHKSLAMQITRERLALLSKKGKCKASLSIEDLSLLGKQGTLVKIVIPIQIDI